MHYFSVYIGTKGIPADRVAEYLDKARDRFLASPARREDERFFFIANPHSDICHFVMLNPPGTGKDQVQKLLLESDRKGKNARLQP